jgi:hypothetical protein
MPRLFALDKNFPQPIPRGWDDERGGFKRHFGDLPTDNDG